MAARKTIKSTNPVAVEKTTATENIQVENEKKEDIKETEKVIKEVKTKPVAIQEPLSDSEEIEVVSLVPHVSYKDSKTGDMYEWDNVGHSEYLTVETLKNLWRNHKAYFKNLMLKPCDDRVINHFGLNKTFEQYEYLMKGSNYTRSNIAEICNIISNTPSGLKYSLYIKIKNMVMHGEITDISVVRTLEKRLDIELSSNL